MSEKDNTAKADDSLGTNHLAVCCDVGQLTFEARFWAYYTRHLLLKRNKCREFLQAECSYWNQLSTRFTLWIQMVKRQMGQQKGLMSGFAEIKLPQIFWAQKSKKIFAIQAGNHLKFKEAIRRLNGRYLQRRSDTILGTFYCESMHTQWFQTLITLLFKDCWVSN